MEIKRIRLTDLEQNKGQVEGLPSNPRQWGKGELDDLVKSIRETPELLEARGLIVWPYGGKYIILGGNMRFSALREMNEVDAPCYVMPEDTPMEKLREIVIKDNGSFGSWDYDMLANEWDDLPLSDWGVPAWDTANLESVSAPKEVEEDDFDETKDHIEVRCKRGDVWQLGDHRLMCGDSTLREDVDNLLGSTKVDLVLTDPPYGINLDGDNSKRVSAAGLRKGGLKLKSFVDDSTIYAVKAFEIVQEKHIPKQVWFGANYYCHSLPETNNWLIWDKRVEDKMANVNSDAELAWVLDGHNSCRIFRHLWNGLIKASEAGERRVHPTQKPIALWVWCVEKYAPDASVILDLFGGSGSTLMAAEQTGRKARVMELDPHYCDVIIARWEKATGKEAVLCEE